MTKILSAVQKIVEQVLKRNLSTQNFDLFSQTNPITYYPQQSKHCYKKVASRETAAVRALKRSAQGRIQNIQYFQYSPLFNCFLAFTAAIQLLYLAAYLTVRLPLAEEPPYASFSRSLAFAEFSISLSVIATRSGLRGIPKLQILNCC